MADSPLENVEMQRAVARFTTAVPILDTLTDYQFEQYESAILGLCKKHKDSVHLETLVKRLAVKYAVDFAELNEQARILAQDIYEIADRYNSADGKRYCRICKKRLPLALFRQRKNGSYGTACWDCEREEKRLYQQGRERKRACAKA